MLMRAAGELRTLQTEAPIVTSALKGAAAGSLVWFALWALRTVFGARTRRMRNTVG